VLTCHGGSSSGFCRCGSRRPRRPTAFRGSCRRRSVPWSSAMRRIL